MHSFLLGINAQTLADVGSARTGKQKLYHIM